MGNLSSSTDGNRALDREMQQQQHLGGAAASNSKSGVSVASDVVEHIIHDFKRELLEDEWSAHQGKILQRSQQHERQAADRHVKLQKEIDSWSAENSFKQNKINNAMDAVNAQFADLKVEISHETTRLEKTLLRDGGGSRQRRLGNDDSGEKDQSHRCLNARTNLALCYSHSKNALACDDLSDILERCVKKAIMAHSPTQ